MPEVKTGLTLDPSQFTQTVQGVYSQLSALKSFAEQLGLKVAIAINDSAVQATLQRIGRDIPPVPVKLIADDGVTPAIEAIRREVATEPVPVKLIADDGVTGAVASIRAEVEAEPIAVKVIADTSQAGAMMQTLQLAGGGIGGGIGGTIAGGMFGGAGFSPPAVAGGMPLQAVAGAGAMAGGAGLPAATQFVNPAAAGPGVFNPAAGGGLSGFGGMMMRGLLIHQAMRTGIGDLKGIGGIADLGAQNIGGALTGNSWTTDQLQAYEKQRIGFQKDVAEAGPIGGLMSGWGDQLYRGYSATENWAAGISGDNAVSRFLGKGTAGNSGQQRGFESDLSYGERVEGLAKAEDKVTEKLEKQAKLHGEIAKQIDHHVDVAERKAAIDAAPDALSKTKVAGDLTLKDLNEQLQRPEYHDRAGRLTEEAKRLQRSTQDEVAADNAKAEKDEAHKRLVENNASQDVIADAQSRGHQADMRAGGDDRGAALEAHIHGLDEQANNAKNAAEAEDNLTDKIRKSVEAMAIIAAVEKEKAAARAEYARQTKEFADQQAIDADREKLRSTPHDFQAEQALWERKRSAQRAKLSPADQPGFDKATASERQTRSEQHRQDLDAMKAETAERHSKIAELDRIEEQNRQARRAAGSDHVALKAADDLGKARLGNFVHDNRPRSQVMSMEEYERMLLVGGANDDGAAAAVKRAKDDMNAPPTGLPPGPYGPPAPDQYEFVGPKSVLPNPNEHWYSPLANSMSALFSGGSPGAAGGDSSPFSADTAATRQNNQDFKEVVADFRKIVDDAQRLTILG